MFGTAIARHGSAVDFPSGRQPVFSGDSLSVEFNHKIPRIQHSFLLTIESSWCQQNYELEFQSPYINTKQRPTVIQEQKHILSTSYIL